MPSFIEWTGIFRKLRPFLWSNVTLNGHSYLSIFWQSSALQKMKCTLTHEIHVDGMNSNPQQNCRGIESKARPHSWHLWKRPTISQNRRDTNDTSKSRDIAMQFSLGTSYCWMHMQASKSVHQTLFGEKAKALFAVCDENMAVCSCVAKPLSQDYK